MLKTTKWLARKRLQCETLTDAKRCEYLKETFGPCQQKNKNSFILYFTYLLLNKRRDN
jgi:hypothetical protein